MFIHFMGCMQILFLDHVFTWAITFLTKHTIPIRLSICLRWGMEQDGKPLGTSLEHSGHTLGTWENENPFPTNPAQESTL
jgi:hypothetical protein